LLLPQAGGPIFVPARDFQGADGLSGAIVQADLNAAVNLGLRAVADPRLWEIHQRLRTERVKGAADHACGDGSAVRLRAREKRKFGSREVPLDLPAPPRGGVVEDGRNPNYFFDGAGLSTWDTASVPDPSPRSPKGKAVTLSSGKALWSTVKKLQWERCEEINRARLHAGTVPSSAGQA